MQGGGYIIYGNVSLPNDTWAARVKMKMGSFNGLDREAQTDGQRRCEFALF